MKLETERLIIDPVREEDKEDYFHNISHDSNVLETFVSAARKRWRPSIFPPVRGRTTCSRSD